MLTIRTCSENRAIGKETQAGNCKKSRTESPTHTLQQASDCPDAHRNMVASFHPQKASKPLYGFGVSISSRGQRPRSMTYVFRVNVVETVHRISEARPVGPKMAEKG